MTGLIKDETNLNALGYDAQLCLIDLGSTAENVVLQKISQEMFNYIMIGAGIRALPENFFLFEKLINLIHQNAPTAKICFNTNPSDTAEAILRWT